jgi:hypothetical protein
MYSSAEIFDAIMQRHALATNAKTHAKKAFPPAIARELANAIDSLEEIKAIAAPGAKDKLCAEILAFPIPDAGPAEQSPLVPEKCDCGNPQGTVVLGLARLVIDLLGIATRLLRGGPVLEAPRRIDTGVSKPPSGDQQAA